MPKISRSARDDRRQHILNAAEECFARDGFHRTTIADIRKKAGVSTGAIYNYFPNKEAIVRAIFEQAHHTRLAQLRNAANGTESGVLQARLLLDWLKGVFGDQGQHWARMDANLWAEALRNPKMAKIAKQALSDATQAVSAVTEERMRSAGYCQLVSPNAVASILVSIYLGTEIQTVLGLSINPGEVSSILSALFALALQTPTQPRPSRATGPRTPGRVENL
jgi:TetR/AcrR family transcriptional regulator, transcriptional repressor of aconitase